jgi:hypothetical protein
MRPMNERTVLTNLGSMIEPRLAYALHFVNQRRWLTLPQTMDFSSLCRAGAAAISSLRETVAPACGKGSSSLGKARTSAAPALPQEFWSTET